MTRILRGGNKAVANVWKGNASGTCVVTLPKAFCELFNIGDRSMVVLEVVKDGILIKKLQI